uniref:Uncharacterized protein n=1 Tax=Anguilla anguilla TaxID=7936 RepID=A0A0E9PDZ3_ANGAN
MIMNPSRSLVGSKFIGLEWDFVCVRV